MNKHSLEEFIGWLETLDPSILPYSYKNNFHQIIALYIEEKHHSKMEKLEKVAEAAKLIVDWTPDKPMCQADKDLRDALYALGESGYKFKNGIIGHPHTEEKTLDGD